MGSPVFPFLANLFMELLEKKAIATAPFECKPKFFEVVCGRCFGTDNEGSSEEPYGVRTTLTPLIPLATSSSPTKRRRTSRSHFWTLFQCNGIRVTQTSLRNSDRVASCGGTKYRLGIKILQFMTNQSLYLANDTRLCHSYYGTLIGSHMRSIVQCDFQ